MSFLDGLGEMLGNRMYDSLMESATDIHEEFSEALEAATDVKLSEADYAAILDDTNPDNQMADLESGEEFKPEEAVSSEEAEDGSLESMIRQYRGMQMDAAEEELIRACEALDAACEDDTGAEMSGPGAARPAELPPMDPSVELDDGSELAGVNEKEEPDEAVSLESLLASVFKV